MKNIFEAARAATTSTDLACHIGEIDIALSKLRQQRDGVYADLQSAIVAGRDFAKIEARIAEIDREIRTAEAALTGFARRRIEFEHAEQRADADALLASYEALSATFGETSARLATAINQARVEALTWHQQYEKLDAKAEALQSQSKIVKRPASVARAAFGPVPGSKATMPLPRRTDDALADLLDPIALRMPRRPNSLQDGRHGEGLRAKRAIQGAYNGKPAA